MISSIVSSVSSLLLIIVVGIYAGKKQIITQDGNKVLIHLILNVILPILILNSFISGNTEEVRANILNAFYLSSLIFLITIALSYLLLIPVKGRERTILQFSNIFPNAAYIGFPLLMLLYGPAGVVYGSIFNMLMNLLMWSYGIFILEKASGDRKDKQSLWALVTNPNLVAVYLGLGLMFAEVPIPSIILSTTGMIAGITGPLSMVAIGVTITAISFRNKLTNLNLYYGIISRLIIIPLLTVWLLHLFQPEFNLVTKSLLVILAMPTASITSILAEKFEFETDFATILVVLTTILTVVTAPLIIQMIEHLGA